MDDGFEEILGRLRRSFSAKADRAYEERDAAPEGSRAAAYAEGEGHAFGVAEDEVRAAQQANE